MESVLIIVGDQPITLGVMPKFGSNLFSGSGVIRLPKFSKFRIETDRIDITQLHRLQKLKVVSFNVLGGEIDLSGFVRNDDNSIVLNDGGVKVSY